jgi:ABC-type transport system involved in cytochrome c biogenesis permease component
VGGGARWRAAGLLVNTLSFPLLLPVPAYSVEISRRANYKGWHKALSEVPLSALTDLRHEPNIEILVQLEFHD